MRCIVSLLIMTACFMNASKAHAADSYRSPYHLSFSPDGALVAVSDRSNACVYLIDVESKQVRYEVELQGQPTGLTWSPDGASLYVAEYDAGTIAEIDPTTARITRRIQAGTWPLDIVFVPDGKTLVVADFPMNRVVLIDTQSEQELGSIPVPRQPFSIEIGPQGRFAVVSNLLPHTFAQDPVQAAAVSIIDLVEHTNIADIPLPPGSTNVRQIAIAPNGLAYVVHTIGRNHLPTTQVERGWVNSNAVSIIDLQSRKRVDTILLDYLFEGAADPWGVEISPDGQFLWVTIAGAHQIAEIDLSIVSTLLDDTSVKLENNMAILRRSKAIRRVPVAGKGPRGIAVPPDGSTLAVATFFTGHLLFLDAQTLETLNDIPLGNQPEPDQARLGEQIFHDATFVKQTWLACVTCHSEARVDGLNWDNLNDGRGNPKNAKSLVWSYITPPMMARGVRASMEIASEAGFRHIAFQQVDPADLEATRQYLRSLKPAPSPYLAADGTLSKEALKGYALFNSEAVGCAHCHDAPLFTNLKMFDVGTRSRFDQAYHFDTPTLVELWRTGPYLHDGSAATVREILIDRNPKDRHGRTSQLNEQELNALIAYLLSL